VSERSSKRHETDGIALALTFLISGGLSLVAPAYFAATGWQETTWHVAGLVLATVGASGLIAELSPTVGGKSVLSDLAVGLILLGFALSVALALAAWSLPSPLEGLGRWLVAFTVFFALYGLLTGIRQSIRHRKSSSRPSTRRANFVAVVVAILGAATAALNLYAAFKAIPTKP
jgi:hypothetical protein